jgi:diaminopimelate epimerase
VGRVAFKKYEGLGNDFIVMDVPRAALPPGAVERLCDRHFGVGADGVLLVVAPESTEAAAKMIVVNADGSTPEMCGNGLRCVAMHVATRLGHSDIDLVIETDAGPLRCAVAAGEVEVQMGKVTELGPVEVRLDAGAHRFTRISTGNPHAITFEPYDRNQIEQVGPRVAVAPVFPRGTNVEFARLRDDGSIDLIVWERGVGLTLACGTGACATVGAACLAGLRPFGTPVTVHLPGGDLRITVDRESREVTMRGSAKLVFQGEVTIP